MAQSFPRRPNRPNGARRPGRSFPAGPDGALDLKAVLAEAEFRVFGLDGPAVGLQLRGLGWGGAPSQPIKHMSFTYRGMGRDRLMVQVSVESSRSRLGEPPSVRDARELQAIHSIVSETSAVPRLIDQLPAGKRCPMFIDLTPALKEAVQARFSKWTNAIESADRPPLDFVLDGESVVVRTAEWPDDDIRSATISLEQEIVALAGSGLAEDGWRAIVAGLTPLRGDADVLAWHQSELNRLNEEAQTHRRDEH